MKQSSIRREAYLVPLALVVLMIIIQLIKPTGCFGIIPRYVQGLRGILLAPLFHSGWKHLFSNAFPIFTLGFMIFSFYRQVAYLLIIFGWLLTGTLVWFFADLGLLPSDTGIGCHIGASGLVYVLASFVFSSGIFRRSSPLIAVSLIVVFLYGSMLWGIFPEEVIRYSAEQANISWESHAAGALVGTSFALIWKNIGPQKERWAWQEKNYNSQKDEELWQRYLESENEENKMKSTE